MVSKISTAARFHLLRLSAQGSVDYVGKRESLAQAINSIPRDILSLPDESSEDILYVIVFRASRKELLMQVYVPAVRMKAGKANFELMKRNDIKFPAQVQVDIASKCGVTFTPPETDGPDTLRG